jgi:diguanylate cyclase (GGDEF)-like protein
MKHARRHNERMVLFFADLDDLKVINDTFGHVSGDRALADTAQIFRETFRDSDIIARMGGDEFAVILGNAPDSGIATVRDRLDKHLAEYNARRDGTFRLSVSVGLSIFDPARPVTVDELIREADARMYEQKQAEKGRPGTDLSIRGLFFAVLPSRTRRLDIVPCKCYSLCY